MQTGNRAPFLVERGVVSNLFLSGVAPGAGAPPLVGEHCLALI